MQIRRFGLAAFLTGTASLASAGDSPYQYIELGTLGGPASAAFGLNDARQVVGWAHIDNCLVDGVPCRRAFLWHDGTMVDLGLLVGDEGSFARAINEAGVVVGTSELDVVAASGTYRGVIWDGSPIDQLPDFGDGRSFAHDINDKGTIAGHAVDQTVIRDRAVTWSGGAIQNVGTGEGHSYNRAYGINEFGLVTGFAWDLFSPNDAIVFDGTKWFTIGGNDGPFQNAEAMAINDAGVVVGYQAFPSGSWHGAVWEFGQPAVDVGLLPGMELSELYDVNESGVAVGRSYGGFPEVSRAVIWENGVLTDLNDLLPAGVDGVLWEAREINEHGDITGTMVIDGFYQAVLLARTDAEATWQPLGHPLAGEAGTPLLVGAGDLVGDGEIALSIRNGAPDAPAWLLVGFSEVDLPLLLGTLVPYPNVTIGSLPLDAKGSFDLAATWPTGLPAGFSTWWQAWILDATGPAGWTATNGLRRVTQ